MIHSLYIINTAGICIYSEYFAKSKVDEQLLSGFLTAIGSFSQEAIGGALQKLNIRTGEQMVLYYHEPSKLTIVAIANANDHQGLLQNLLNKIITAFYDIFKKHLKEQGLFEDTSSFRTTCRKILERKSASRGKKQLILGLVLGLILLGFLVLLTRFLYIFLSNAFSNAINDVTRYHNDLSTQIAIYLGWDPSKPFDPSTFFIYLQAASIASLFFNTTTAIQAHFFNTSIGAQSLLLLSFVPSSLLGGYVAGSRKNGKWIGFLFFGLAFIFFLIFTEQLIFFILVYLPLILICSFVFGYLGGLLREMYKLYPLSPEKKLDATKEKPSAERGILTKLEYTFGVFGGILFVAGIIFENPVLLLGIILLILTLIFEIIERKKS